MNDTDDRKQPVEYWNKHNSHKIIIILTIHRNTEIYWAYTKRVTPQNVIKLVNLYGILGIDNSESWDLFLSTASLWKTYTGPDINTKENKPVFQMKLTWN
jgi:hypothetical protein